MAFAPIRDMILVRRDPSEDITPSGIVVPTAEDKPSGHVVACGKGRNLPNGTRRPMSVSSGDHIVFPNLAEYERLVVDGEELLLIREADVVGIIPPT